VTSQKDIQSLIADIDSILPKVDARLPWSKPGDAAKQRRVLERVRSYLVAQQQNFLAASENPPPPTNSTPTAVAQQIAQAVTQEINVLHADLLQALQTDLEALRTERDSLVREIRQLEGTRQQLASLPQQKIVQQQVISEFSQELIARCTESLTQQMAHILANVETRWISTSQSITEAITPNPAHWGNLDRVKPLQDRLEQLRQVQLQSDQMLTTLDANQRSIFETLQRNLESYQESLSQGLDKMHRLGLQGEMLYTAFVNRLVQQLGREASTHVASLEQLSDALDQTNQAASHQTTSETLLPTNALSVTQQSFYTNVDTSDTTNPALKAQPNPLFGEQLHPLSQVESFLPEYLSGISSPETQAPLDNLAAMPLTPPSVNASEGLGVAMPEASDEQSFLENLHSEDWEIIEGLDFAVLDVEADTTDEIDTFIQLNLEPQASLPSREPTDASAEQTFGFENRRTAIDELYESLFGTDSLSNSAPLDESEESTSELPKTFLVDLTLENSQPPTSINFSIPRNDQIPSTDQVDALFPNLEDILFEGLADPATEHPPAQPLEWLAEQSAEPWEVLFSDELMPQSSTQADLAVEAEASLLAASEQESIRTIAALTDLFEEMGLSYGSLTSEDNSISVTNTNNPQRDDRNFDTHPQSPLGEESYIPAAPEEDLLTADGLEQTSGKDFSVDQSTLQQLQQDLHSFEEFENRQHPSQQEQRSPDNNFESPDVIPDAAQVIQHNQWFPMWEELLAEDWEEVIRNGSPTEQPNSQQEISPSSLENEIVDSSRVVPESVDSDFEPELFPSEALELDQENTINLLNATTPGFTNSGEPVSLEEETFLDEMQWDDATDSTTEERISSPELGVELHGSSPSTIEPQPEGTVSSTQPGESLTPDREAGSQMVQDESIHDIPATRLPPQAFDNELDVSPDAAQHAEQQNNELNSERNLDTSAEQ
jgi:hypothetical protein